jgi:transitional endoplasmic reticulum ATPase
MATELNKRNVVMVAEVMKSGEKILIPENMTVRQSIETLVRFEAAQEEEVNVLRSFDAFPWDGAVALSNVLNRKYGWTNAVGTPGWFGKKPPTMVPVEVGYKKTIQVPWGRFELAGYDGAYLETRVGERHNRKVFEVVANVKRKYEADIASLFDKVAVELDEHSIYRGKAVEIDFEQTNEENGLVEPKFLNVEVDENALVLTADVLRQVETEIFTPILRAEELARHGISSRACVLLEGKPGTGKTTVLSIAAKLATRHGIFTLKIKSATQLAQGILFAAMYEGEKFALIECEDIDRVTSGERTLTLDNLLNTVDGVDSKTRKVFCIFTTNDVKSINDVTMRRLREVIRFDLPDADCVERLIRYYGKGIVQADADLAEVGKALAGLVPASMIHDLVDSAKLAELKLSPVGIDKLMVGPVALMEAAVSKDRQAEYIRTERVKPLVPTIDLAIRELVVGAMADAVGSMAMEGDKLVLKEEVYKFRTSGAQIKLLDN